MKFKFLLLLVFMTSALHAQYNYINYKNFDRSASAVDGDTWRFNNHWYIKLNGVVLQLDQPTMFTGTLTPGKIPYATGPQTLGDGPGWDNATGTLSIKKLLFQTGSVIQIDAGPVFGINMIADPLFVDGTFGVNNTGGDVEFTVDFFDITMNVANVGGDVKMIGPQLGTGILQHDALNRIESYSWVNISSHTNSTAARINTPNLTVTTALNNTALTNGGVPVIGASGLFTTDPDISFLVDRLTVTKLTASTDLTLTGLAQNQVLFGGASGAVTSDPDLTFLTAGGPSVLNIKAGTASSTYNSAEIGLWNLNSNSVIPSWKIINDIDQDGTNSLDFITFNGGTVMRLTNASYTPSSLGVIFYGSVSLPGMLASMYEVPFFSNNDGFLTTDGSFQYNLDNAVLVAPRFESPSQTTGRFAVWGSPALGVGAEIESTSSFSFTGTTATFSNHTVTTALRNTALTTDRVPVIGASGLFTDSPNLTFASSVFGVGGRATVTQPSTSSSTNTLALTSNFTAALGSGSPVGLSINMVYNTTGTYSGTGTGLLIDATRTSVTGLTEQALRANGGQSFFASSSSDVVTANTRLDVRGVGGSGNILRLGSSSNTQRMIVREDGFAQIDADVPGNAVYYRIQNGGSPALSLITFDLGNRYTGNGTIISPGGSGMGMAGVSGSTLSLNGVSLAFLNGSQPTSAGQFIFNGSLAPNASYHVELLGGMNVTSGIANSKSLRVAPTLTNTSSSSSTYMGIDYDPTVNTITNVTHLAMRTARGQILFANSNTDVVNTFTRLDVRGTGTTNGFTMKLSASDNTNRFFLRDNGQFLFTSDAMNNQIQTGGTGTINLDYALLFNGTVIGSSTSGHTTAGIRIAYTTRSGATNQTMTSLLNFSTLDVLHTGVTMRGFSYMPTIGGTPGAFTHAAWYHNSGFVQWDATVSPAQITANQNDYNPNGLTSGGAPYGSVFLRVTTDQSRNITSIAGGVAGRILGIMNVGSNNVVLKDDDGATGTAANRFEFNSDITLLPSATAFLVYDGTSSRWRAISSTTFPGGTDGQIQFKSGSAFLGSNLSYNSTTSDLTHSLLSGSVESYKMTGSLSASSGSQAIRHFYVQTTDNFTGTFNGQIIGFQFGPTITSSRGFMQAFVATGGLNLSSGSAEYYGMNIGPSVTLTGGTGTVYGISYNNSPSTSTGVLNQIIFRATGSITATSGTNNYTGVDIGPTYNTTLSHTGGTARGFYYHPTNTSLVGLTHIALETTSGEVRFGGITQDDTKTRMAVLDNSTGQVFWRDATTFQAADLDLAALAALSTTGYAKRTGANTWVLNATVPWSDISATPTTLSGYGITDAQPLDSDLTTIAGLTATTDNFIVSSASAWASRTPSQVRTTLGLIVGTDVQAQDADLQTIAGLTATTDNFIVSVSSAWASRTPAQVRTTLGLVIGTNVQAQDADLDAIAALATTGYARRTGSNTWALSSTIPWSDISSTPTTLAGYGITNGTVLGTAWPLSSDGIVSGDVYIYPATNNTRSVVIGMNAATDKRLLYLGLQSEGSIGIGTNNGDIIIGAGDAIEVAAVNFILYTGGLTERLEIENDGAWQVNSSTGTSGYPLITNGGTTSPGWQQLGTVGIANDAVTFAKFQNISTDRLLGRDAASTGDPEEISVGGGIEFTGSGGIQTSAFTGDVTKSAGGTSTTISNDVVTLAKIQNAGSASKLLGSGSSGSGTDYSEITLGTNLFMSGTTLNASGGSPAGSDTEIQINDGGSFGTDPGAFTYSKSINALTIGDNATNTNAEIFLLGDFSGTDKTMRLFASLNHATVGITAGITTNGTPLVIQSDSDNIWFFPSNYLVFRNVPTSNPCGSAPSGTVWNSSGTLRICP